MSTHDDSGHGFLPPTSMRSGRGGEHAGGGGDIAPGKRTATAGLRAADPVTANLNTLREAELGLVTVAVRYLPTLRATIDDRRMQDARSASGDLAAALGRIDRQLASVRRWATIAGREGAFELLAPLEAQRDALRAEAAPVLALAPPAAPHLPVAAAFDFATMMDTAPAYDEAEAANRTAWDAQLEAAEAPRDNVIDASDRFGQPAVQRRAAADGAARDPAAVQAHASAGVAGTGAALPHLDAIQASFGAHDVSGVRAHVGGAAAEASAAIGAEAYATGNDVAFASSPSLFVAAHEAAHVVQQRAGVSLLGGVGVAGDAYEQHADAVADAVVRGESAEGLLGRATAAGGTLGVQRKDRSEDDIHASVVNASLRTAQHWLDEAVRAMRRPDLDGTRDDLLLSLQTAGRVKMHFDEALHVLDGAAATVFTSTAASMDDVSQAMREFLEVSLLLDCETPGTEEIVSLEQRLRARMGLEAYAAARGHKAATKKNDVYEGKALGAVLELVEHEAEKAYASLVDDGDRTTIVAAATESLSEQLDHARRLLDVHEAKDEAEVFGPRIEAASAAVLKVHRWLLGRQDIAGLLEAFGAVLKKTDRVRASVGLDPVETLKTPEVPIGEYEEEENEKAALGIAEKQYYDALDAALDGFELGAERFFKISQLTHAPSETSLWNELASGVLIAILSNLVGPAAGRLVRGGASRTGATATDAVDPIADMIGSTVTDSVQASASTLASAAIDKVSGKNQELRDRLLFTEWLIGVQVHFVTMCKGAVAELVGAKRVSAGELEAAKSHAEAAQSAMDELAYQSGAHGFALLTARLSLGVEQNAEGNDVTKLDDYITPKSPLLGARLAPYADGAAGVARVMVEIPDSDDQPPRISGFRINGSNGDLALAVLQRGGFQLDRLELPLHLHIDLEGKRGTLLSMPHELVIDEFGDVRGASRWALDDLGSYSTPEALWSALRRAKVPTDAVTLS